MERLTKILEESEICGYTFKELVMFAEACQKQGIKEEDLKLFCVSVEGAAQYALDKLEEALDHEITKEFGEAEQEGEE